VLERAVTGSCVCLARSLELLRASARKLGGGLLCSWRGLGELPVCELKRGALEADLGAQVGAVLATAAPAESVELGLGVGEPLFGSR